MFRSSSFLLLSMCIVFASPILVYCSCTDVPSSIKTPCTRFAKYRWYYISHRGTCRKYKWDGCGEGEAPGFRKWSSCKQAHCACHLHPQEGPCRSFARGYYFDQEEKKCRDFHWGGCGGVNPFRTMDKCIAAQCQVNHLKMNI